MSALRPIEMKLSNGIPVILQHHEGGVAATYWWNQVGSADERPAEAGFSHFLEHMLFKDSGAKDTGQPSTGKMARAIESLGGDVNAYTSFDQTVYHVTCAEHHWVKMIDAFGPMAKPQKFLKADFEREREVILEELKKNEDAPGRQFFQAIFTDIFSVHPYGKPVIGYRKTLNAAKVTDLEAYYRRMYIPSRMGLVLTGPVLNSRMQVRPELMQALERNFGSKIIPARKGEARQTRKMDQQVRSFGKPRLVPFDVKSWSTALSFRVPGLSHEDIPALDVLAGVLGMGESSRLYQRLFSDEGIVTDVSAGMYVPSDPGMIYLQADFESADRLDQVTNALFEEIDRLSSDGATREELERVVTNTESEKLYAGQTADGLASRLGFLKFVMGDLSFDRDYLDELKAVDSDDVRRVAATYLRPERMSAVLMHPQGEKASWSAVEKQARDRKKQKSKKEAPREAANRSSYYDFTTERGLRVSTKHVPGSPVFSIHLSAFGGLRGEWLNPVRTGEKDWGASHLLGMTWAKGTATRSARQIASIVESAAAGLDGFSGRNTIGLQVTGLVRDWDKLTELLQEVVVAPSFSDEEVEHSRRVALDSIRGIEDHSAQLCSKLFLEGLFDEHPYSRTTLGSIDSVTGLDGNTLREFHRRWVTPSGLVLGVSGGIGRDEVQKLAKSLESRFKEAGRTQVAPSVSDVVLKSPRWIERSLGREQVHLLVGGTGLKVRSPERWTLRLLHTLLGGQSGRLFIELREKKSLAYSVAPTSFEGVEAGYVGTYIACSQEKKNDAILGIQKVYEEFVRKGPTKAEISRAKEYYLGRRAMDLQSEASVAAHLGLETLYGVERKDDAMIAKILAGVSAADLREVCRKYLVEAPMVTAAVG